MTSFNYKNLTAKPLFQTAFLPLLLMHGLFLALVRACWIAWYVIASVAFKTHFVSSYPCSSFLPSEWKESVWGYYIQVFMYLVVDLHGLELCFFQGFVSAVSHMRSFVPAVYDITLAIPKSSPQPTMLRLFKGQSSVVSEQNLKFYPTAWSSLHKWMNIEIISVMSSVWCLLAACMQLLEDI